MPDQRPTTNESFSDLHRLHLAQCGINHNINGGFTCQCVAVVNCRDVSRQFIAVTAVVDLADAAAAAAEADCHGSCAATVIAVTLTAARDNTTSHF